MDKLLIVDDDAFVRKALSKILSAHYQVLTAESGEKAVDVAQAETPNTILLDVEMPGLNGYETCDLLKCMPSTKDIPVIFISGKGSVRERLLGYESGGEDYIVKPPETEELLAKVSVTVKNFKRIRSLGDSASSANDLAHIALKSQGDMGTVIQYIEQVGIVPSYDLLAKKLLDTCKSYGLSAVVGMNTHEEDNAFYSSQGEVSQLEKDVIELKSRDHRFVDFGQRTLINYSRMSLLIKNMPLDDMDLYGRIKDLFPPILAASNAHLISLINRASILEVSTLVSQSVSVIEEKFDLLKNNIGSAVDDFVDSANSDYFQMENSLLKLGLEADQEEHIMEMFSQNLTRSTSLADTRKELETAFSRISALLFLVEEKQISVQQLASETVLASEAEVMGTIDEEAEDGGVELF